MPENLYEEHRYLALQPKYVDASASEAEFVFPESADEARAAGNLGDKRLMVLTEGKNEMQNNDGVGLADATTGGCGVLRLCRVVW